MNIVVNAELISNLLRAYNTPNATVVISGAQALATVPKTLIQAVNPNKLLIS